jgi:acyl-CoA reductase-like NAD-dependent aldehyde dehydrogenase
VETTHEAFLARLNAEAEDWDAIARAAFRLGRRDLREQAQRERDKVLERTANRGEQMKKEALAKFYAGQFPTGKRVLDAFGKPYAEWADWDAGPEGVTFRRGRTDGVTRIPPTTYA